MIQTLKSFFKKGFARCGFDIRSQKKLTLSDDPIYIISKILDPLDVKFVIDGGASIGHTSQKFSSLFPYAEIHAFEPFPDFHDALQQKTVVNPKIKFHNLALGNENCSGILNINESKGTNSLFKNSDKAKEIYGSLMNSEDVIEVGVTSLDNWIKPLGNQAVDILKLDLQGGELNAIKGAEHILKRGLVKCMICEFMFEPTYMGQPSWIELANIIEGYGLRLFSFYQPYYYNGQLIQADLLFLNQSSINSSQMNRKCSFFPFTNILNLND